MPSQLKIKGIFFAYGKLKNSFERNIIMTHADFLKTINSVNYLTEKGFPALKNEGDQNKKRKDFENRYEEFRLCCEWIKKFSYKPSKKQINKMSKNYSSYYLKHLVEKYSNRYISNGAFIAAVIHLNIPYRRIFGTPDISVTLSLKEKSEIY